MIRTLTIPTLLVVLLAACSGEKDNPQDKTGLLPDRERQELYDFYAESEGRSTRWVDQHVCTVSAAVAVTSVAIDEVYPSLSADANVEREIDDAIAMGDEDTAAALREATTQGMLLAQQGVLTAREAIESAVAVCPTDELDEVHVRMLVDSQIELLELLTEGAAYTSGGPVWISPDGHVQTRECGWHGCESTDHVPPENTPDTSPPSSSSLEDTFSAMIDAMAENGEDGLLPFLADDSHGDPWGISSHRWYDTECFEDSPTTSGCVAHFDKDGRKLEVVFMFESVGGAWKLTDSYVWD